MYARLRNWVFNSLEGDSKRSQRFNIFIIILIVLNVAAVIVQSHFRKGHPFREQLDIFESVSVIVFSAEYLLRLWSCVEAEPKKRYLKSRIGFVFRFSSIIDLLAILPFYVSVGRIGDARVLRTIRLLRFFRVFKLGRYTKSLALLGQVFKARFPDIVSSMLLVAVLLIFSSSLMYFAEREAQPLVFPNITETMWWGIATLSGADFGDVQATTTTGKLITALVSLLGIGVFALPAGILASGYSEALEEARNGSPDNRITCPHCEAEFEA